MCYNRSMKEKIAQIGKKYGLEMIILFGSMATGHARQDSDIDIAIIKNKELTARQEAVLSAELQHVLGKEVDLVDIADAGALLLGQIGRDGKLLYGNNKRFISAKLYFTKQFIDFMPYFRLREKMIRQNIKKLTTNAR